MQGEQCLRSVAVETHLKKRGQFSDREGEGRADADRAEITFVDQSRHCSW